MNKVLICTDSTCDLSNDIINQHNIKIIPLHITFGEKSYDDRIDINLAELYERVENTGEMPKTAACSPNEFVKFLKPYINDGYDIFYTGIGSGLSTTYQSICIAMKEFPEGRIFASDSQNLSTGIGLLLLKACKYRDRGLSAKEIKERIDSLVPHVKVQFVIKTLDFLHKGGRCSSLTKIFGTMLRIRPMIVVRDGKLKVGKKVVGLMKKAVAVMTNTFIKDLPNIDLDNVFITNTTASDASYEEINASFEKYGVANKVKNIYHTTAGCVIGSHCGPGTIGILYIMKGDMNDEEFDDDKL